MMDDEHDDIPTIGEYRGVGLHDQQDEARLEVVKREIDAVMDIGTDIKRLVEVCADQRRAPEARLLAAARLKAMVEISAEDRRSRPPVDIAYIDACTASLNSRYWRSPWHFGSLLEPGRPPGVEGPARRPVPLERE